MAGPASTNYEKFQTGNPVVRRLIDRFYDGVAEEVRAVSPSSALDAGCGEGESLIRLDGLLPERTAGIDIDAAAVEYTRERVPTAEISQHSVESLPFADGDFDLVLCLEVLEHIPEPAGALRELARVAAGGELLISVPHEPWFRLGSLLRGKYVSGLGNHPEHVNHWNHRSLRAFLETQVEVVNLGGSFPWLIARCRARQRRAPDRSRRCARSGPA